MHLFDMFMHTTVYLCMLPNRRRLLIMDILRKSVVSSQDEIALALSDAGVTVTQTTVSRDLAAIGAVRGHDGYRLSNSVSDLALAIGNTGKDDFVGLVSKHVISVAKAQSIVVVKTAPGHAQMMASTFDRWPPDGVVGTVAGDDTIFLATLSAKVSDQLIKTLDAAMQGEQS